MDDVAVKRSRPQSSKTGYNIRWFREGCIDLDTGVIERRYKDRSRFSRALR
jgi:hypothetical protein